MSFDVAVIGSANVDTVLNLDRYPGAGETIVALNSDEAAGGKGLNQSVAAARAGARTAFTGAVGDDGAGRALLEALRANDVDVTSVRVASEPSGRAIVVVQPSGENTIFVVPGANASLTLGDRARKVIASSSVLVAQLEVPVAVVSDAIGTARSAGTTVVLNAAPAISLEDALLDQVDVLIMNEHEAMLLGNADDPLEAAEILNRRVGQTVVTLGAQGAVHLSRSGTADRVPGMPATAVDTTGAGDTFVGVLASSIARGMPMPDALRRGVAAASLAVERPGAVPSIPTWRETDRRLLDH
jgi:ribokinase